MWAYKVHVHTFTHTNYDLQFCNWQTLAAYKLQSVNGLAIYYIQ